MRISGPPAAPFSVAAFPGGPLPTLFGNSGVGILLGPGQFNWDISLVKTTHITERPQTRLKAFAVFLFPDMADVVKDDDIREAHIQELQKLKSAEPALQQVVLAMDGPAALQKAGYEMPPTEQVRVVLYDELKVSKIYNYEKLTDANVKEIVDEVKTKLAPFKKRSRSAAPLAA